MGLYRRCEEFLYEKSLEPASHDYFETYKTLKKVARSNEEFNVLMLRARERLLESMRKREN